MLSCFVVAYCLLGVVFVVMIHGCPLLLGHLLQGEEPIFSHLDALGHVPHRGVFCQNWGTKLGVVSLKKCKYVHI